MLSTSGEQRVNLQELATNKRATGNGEGHKKSVAEAISFPFAGREKTKRNRKAARGYVKEMEEKNIHWKKSTEEVMRTGMAEQRKKGIQG